MVPHGSTFESHYEANVSMHANLHGQCVNVTRLFSYLTVKCYYGNLLHPSVSIQFASPWDHVRWFFMPPADVKPLSSQNIGDVSHHVCFRVLKTVWAQLHRNKLQPASRISWYPTFFHGASEFSSLQTSSHTSRHVWWRLLSTWQEAGWQCCNSSSWTLKDELWPHEGKHLTSFRRGAKANTLTYWDN